MPIVYRVELSRDRVEDICKLIRREDRSLNPVISCKELRRLPFGPYQSIVWEDDNEFYEFGNTQRIRNMHVHARSWATLITRINHVYRAGCLEKDDVLEWFDGQNTRLHKNGFVLSEYNVSKLVTSHEDSLQVVFSRNFAEYVGSYSLKRRR